MNIYVQSLLNSATKDQFTVTTSTTVLQLKQSVWTTTGVTATIMQFYFNNVEMVNTATLGVYGITTGSIVLSSNNIANSTLWTKEQRQVLKLDLAKLRKKAGGNTSAPYYRDFNDYDRDLLAAKYVGNTATSISNTLTEHRPWI